MAKSVKSPKTSTPKVPPVQKAFGTVLRELRLAKGLSQTDLEGEDDIVMDRSTVSKIELGKNQVCINGIFHLADKLGMTPGGLLDEVQKTLKSQKK